jgi:hypothetical protein
VRVYFDAYTRRARVEPVALVLAPLLILFAVLVPVVNVAAGVLGLLFSLALLVGSQLARDAGKALQPQLWAAWGGSPTLRRLRFRDGGAGVEERHRQMELVLGRRLPNAAEEAADPSGADDAYDAATASLRDLTRDRSRFNLLFRENADYGFRRNLLGLQRWGFLASALGFLASIVVLVKAPASGHELILLVLPVVWSLASLAFFGRVVNGDWVRVPAEEYADRLLGALEVLSAEVRAR